MIVPRLKTLYTEQIAPRLKEELGLGNVMEIPRLEKIVVNMGVGDAVQDRKSIDSAMDELTVITGQKPKLNRSRKSIANFKVRANFPVGCMVTLRGARMYEFFDRLVNLAMPRIRDFRGVSRRAFDGRGNYNLGVKEQIIFPEINFDQVDAIRGLDISITTTAQSDDAGRALLEAFKFPLRGDR